MFSEREEWGVLDLAKRYRSEYKNEAPDRATAPRDSDGMVLARVTAEDDGGTYPLDLYPAVLVQYDPSTKTYSDVDGSDCYLSNAGDPYPVLLGAGLPASRYVAIFAGINPADGLPIFSARGPDAAVLDNPAAWAMAGGNMVDLPLHPGVDTILAGATTSGATTYLHSIANGYHGRNLRIIFRNLDSGAPSYLVIKSGYGTGLGTEANQFWSLPNFDADLTLVSGDAISFVYNGLGTGFGAVFGWYCTGWAHCCEGGGSGSGSGSGSGGGGISGAGLGHSNAASSATNTIAAVTVGGGELLAVGVTGPTSVAGGAVTFNGTSLTQAVGETALAGDVTTAIYYLAVGSTTTGDIVFTSASSFPINSAMAAVKVSGLTSNTVDVLFQTHDGSGTSTAPDGGSGIVSGSNYVFIYVGTNGPVGDADGTWQNSFTDGGQDDGTNTGTGDVRGCEGYYIAGNSQSVHPVKSGITARKWSLSGVSFK